MWLRSDRSGHLSRYRNTQRSRAIRKMPNLTSIVPLHLWLACNPQIMRVQSPPRVGETSGPEAP
ncbi:hypothetical protein BDR03DRAFT_963099 [Suillus americanus]|nr:hypothetical protein BDR03DRAFT_963099 [Suillus americanus]